MPNAKDQDKGTTNNEQQTRSGHAQSEFDLIRAENDECAHDEEDKDRETNESGNIRMHSISVAQQACLVDEDVGGRLGDARGS
jgi:hypothetical protein